MKKKSKHKLNSKRKTYEICDSPLYKLRSKKKLLSLLHISKEEAVIAVQDTDNYVVFEQIGKNGKSRTIQHPKDRHKEIHCRLANLLIRIKVPNYLHSGRKQHSHVTNANQHLGEKRVLTTDISAFFQSTDRDKVFCFFLNIMKCSSDVADSLSHICTYNGHIPTGSQLSMPLAFWSNFRMFDQLEKLSIKHNADMSVYVDDITFSGNSINRLFLSTVRKIITSNGHIAHPEKTKIFGKKDIKVITGVVINGDDTLITNKQNKLIFQSFVDWRACRDEPLIAGLITPKLLGRLNALSMIDPKLKDKAKSVISYKVKN